MFASNVVGLAAATAAGLGNCGGGAALAAMPEVFAAFKRAGFSNDAAWRCVPPAQPAAASGRELRAPRPDLKRELWAGVGCGGGQGVSSPLA